MFCNQPTMTITVVIPAYNRERQIARAIDSVLGQTSLPDEIIVVDDGSTDGTAEIVRGYADQGVRLIAIENSGSGPSRPRNVGIEAARSTHLALLDSDDYYQPTLIEKQRRLLAMFPDVGLAHSNCARQTGDGVPVDNDAYVVRGCQKQIEQDCYYRLGCDVAYAALCRGNYLTSCTGAVLPKSAWQEVGGFNEELPSSNDYDFFLRILRERELGYIDEPLFVYCLHDDNLSAANQSKRFKPELHLNHIGVLQQELAWTDNSENTQQLRAAISQYRLELAYEYRRHGHFGKSLQLYLRCLREGDDWLATSSGLLKLPLLYWRDRFRDTRAVNANHA